MTDAEAKAAEALARGVNRAAGERARRRRRTTPLLQATSVANDAASPAEALSTSLPDPVESNGSDQDSAQHGVPPTAIEGDAGTYTALVIETSPEVAAASPPRRRKGGAGRPAPVPDGARAPAARRTTGGKRLVAVTDLAEAVQAAADQASDHFGEPEDASSGMSRLVDVFDFVRHRLSGSYQVDEFGFDPEFTDTVFFGVLRVLYQKWFRVEVSGVENIPSEGGALLVSNHAGTVAVDALMLQLAVHDEHPQHRYLRSLGADLVFETPFLGEVARRTGATLASNADAERLLTGGELVAVFPEGFKGIGKPFTERYKLQRFGRGGFVSAALHAQVPIIPVAIVGSEEIYPLVGDIPALARLLGMPYVPVTPLFPLFGPLGLIPLPSKWLIDFGAPVKTDALGAGAAEDPMLVFDITDQVRQTIQQSLYQLLVRRRTVFF